MTWMGTVGGSVRGRTWMGFGLGRNWVRVRSRFGARVLVDLGSGLGLGLGRRRALALPLP